MRKIQLIESRSEICAGTRGASLGPEAIKTASINANSRYFEFRSIIEIPNENHLLFSKQDKSRAKNIVGLKKVFKHFSTEMRKTMDEGFFPLVLAGDHSTAAATIAGIRAKYKEERLGVIWIDAHADLHSPYTTPTGNVHGMPLAISLAEDNLDKKRQPTPDQDIIDKWEELKTWNDVSPKIQASDLVFVAVRDTEEEEDYLMDQLNIKNFTVDEVRQKGIAKVKDEIDSILKECDIIYISFDVDSMDCDVVSHGTGTPVKNGLYPEEAKSLLEELLQNDKVCCLEITEVNPTLDEKKNLMAETAFDILENCTRVLEE